LVLKKIKTRVLVCSTGWTDEQKTVLIKNLGSKNVKWLPNTSAGIEVLIAALETTLKKVHKWEGLKITIFESHHIHKKDAPSGTALWLKEIIKAEMGDTCPTIEIHSQREGEIVGIHTIAIETPLEKIELTHTAIDRKLFALGSLRALLEFAK
jgi:4-hydroxy-tetrahydrodipicolinate reductase